MSFRQKTRKPYYVDSEGEYWGELMYSLKIP